MFSRLKKKRLNAIKKDFQTDSFEIVDNMANFAGIKSKGYSQIRGNGVLALTREYLIFYMWLPQRKFVIPRQSISKVEQVKSFLGKFRAIPLMQITFLNSNGFQDKMAWWVLDLNAWLGRLM
ncbi:MAG: hypothetical protein DRO88_12960 [Promethearchaeia archaeon]|nr:MAG: hypothetical protein DRO88_12960 [Candidatus Lokiarchaeia archaeon]